MNGMTYAQRWHQWHARHERELSDPHGFLAITSLNFLDGTPRRFPDAPGEWSTGDDRVTVALADGEELRVDGVTVKGVHTFDPIPERGGFHAAFGEADAVVEVARRGGFDIIRPRHPGNPLRLGFRGVPAYEPDEAWVLTGRFVARADSVTVGAAVDGLHHKYDSPGVIEFEAPGGPQRLVAFHGRTPGSLSVLFTDATSGVTTYAANRSLAVDEPAADGSVVLDFNRATNLVCAYTDFATCPLPPAENRLAIPVEAGEKIPYERGAVPTG